MTYQTEFPAFAPATMPKLPEGFADHSWGADACPHFVSVALKLDLWIDFAVEAEREFPEMKRFVIYRAAIDAEGRHDGNADDIPILETDDWGAVEAVILGEAFAAECEGAFTDEVMAEIRDMNGAYDPANSDCATHDFADANMIMAAAFEKIFGREPDVSADDDCGLWNRGWDWAKEHHLSTPSA